MSPAEILEGQVLDLLRFSPPDTKESYMTSVRSLIEEVIVSILVSPVSETPRLRGQLEVLLMLLSQVDPSQDIIRETVQSIITAEEN